MSLRSAEACAVCRRRMRVYVDSAAGDVGGKPYAARRHHGYMRQQRDRILRDGDHGGRCLAILRTNIKLIDSETIGRATSNKPSIAKLKFANKSRSDCLRKTFISSPPCMI